MKKILVIDDNADILEVLKTILELKGYEVCAIARGEQTIEMVDKYFPDLVLLDIFLGGCNGVDICAELKSIAHTKQIPVVMMSAHSNIEMVLKTCQADAFVSKPFDLTHLVSVIESQLAKVA